MEASSVQAQQDRLLCQQGLGTPQMSSQLSHSASAGAARHEHRCNVVMCVSPAWAASPGAQEAAALLQAPLPQHWPAQPALLAHVPAEPAEARQNSSWTAAAALLPAKHISTISLLPLIACDAC